MATTRRVSAWVPSRDARFRATILVVGTVVCLLSGLVSLLWHTLWVQTWLLLWAGFTIGVLTGGAIEHLSHRDGTCDSIW